MQKTLLHLLAEKYKTDKLPHGYIPYYEKHFLTKIRSLLEIGCCMGASLRMWDEYFGKDTDIHTIDLFKDHDHASIRSIRREGYIPHQGDQSDVRFLNSIQNSFDIIIDDGSHNSDHQLISFLNLFINKLNSGGMYVVEDLHCCLDPFYWQTDLRIRGVDDTILGALLSFQAGEGFINPLCDKPTREILTHYIKDIVIYDEKIAFITKN